MDILPKHLLLQSINYLIYALALHTGTLQCPQKETGLSCHPESFELFHDIGFGFSFVSCNILMNATRVACYGKTISLSRRAFFYCEV